MSFFLAGFQYCEILGYLCIIYMAHVWDTCVCMPGWKDVMVYLCFIALIKSYILSKSFTRPLDFCAEREGGYFQWPTGRKSVKEPYQVTNPQTPRRSVLRATGLYTCGPEISKHFVQTFCCCYKFCLSKINTLTYMLLLLVGGCNNYDKNTSELDFFYFGGE